MALVKSHHILIWQGIALRKAGVEADDLILITMRGYE